MGKVVSKTGETVRAQGIMYKSVVQSVWLYGSDNWVVTGAMLKLLEGFHHRSERRIMGMTVLRMTSSEWEWPLVAEALETAGI